LTRTQRPMPHQVKARISEYSEHSLLSSVLLRSVFSRKNGNRLGAGDYPPAKLICMRRCRVVTRHGRRTDPGCVLKPPLADARNLIRCGSWR